MKRDMFIPLLKQEILKSLEDEEYADLKERTNEATTIGQLFGVMRDCSYDFQGAVYTVMKILIEDALDSEFQDCPIGGWDT